MNKEKKVIRLGTRKSPLAMAQARLAAEAIERAFPELTAELLSQNLKGPFWRDASTERSTAPRTCRRSWLRDWSSRQRFPGRTPETCW